MFFDKTKVKKSQMARGYQVAPSLAAKLPFIAFDDDANLLLLEDGISLACGFEIIDIPCDLKKDEEVDALCDKFAYLLSSMLPSQASHPWVMQFFVSDDRDLAPLHKRMTEYVQSKGKTDDFTQEYLRLYRDHFNLLTQPEGAFFDPKTDSMFRARIRRIRILIYRRVSSKASRQAVYSDIINLQQDVQKKLKQFGFYTKQINGHDFYAWMVHWFSPKPEFNTQEKSLTEQFPYIKGPKPFGWSLAQNVLLGSVRDEDDSWVFDQLHHQVLVFQDMKMPVEAGFLSRERSFGGGKHCYSLLDKLPAGSVYTATIVFESKHKVRQHLSTIASSAMGGNDDKIKMIVSSVKQALNQLDENTNALFRTCEAIFIRGQSKADLGKITRDIRTFLSDSGIQLYDARQQVFPLDVYLRFLPFAYNYAMDKQYIFLSNYKFADEISSTLPIYGTSKGDAINPMGVFFNNSGQPFLFDPLNKHFKMSNSHMAILGTTGAGKSVLANQLAVNFAATYNPRIIMMEVGGSFNLLAEFFKAHKRTVKTIRYAKKNRIPTNPYADAYKMIATLSQDEPNRAAATSDKTQDEIDGIKNTATDEEINADQERDILSEMVLATRIMITGGERKEEEKISRADMALISRTLIYASKKSHQAHKEQLLVEDVASAFLELAKQEETDALKTRLKHFALCLEAYTTGLKGDLVNKASSELGDFDLLHIDFGFLQEGERYADLLNIVCISLLSKVLAIAEASRTSGRPTILFLDEAHVLFKSDIVAAFVVLAAKVARKIGLWLIPMTQNVKDFSSVETRKILSMMETWVTLYMSRDEIEHVSTFKDLSDEEKNLIASIENQIGLYSEGVLLGSRFKGKFKIIPPRELLSLAMTNQDEVAELKKVQQENNLTLIEAVYRRAQTLKNPKQHTGHDDEVFL